MANLKININDNGDITYTLTFLDQEYTQEVKQCEDGTLLFSETLEEQIKANKGQLLLRALGTDDAEELMINISEISYSNIVDSIGGNITALTEYEEILREAGKNNEI